MQRGGGKISVAGAKRSIDTVLAEDMIGAVLEPVLLQKKAVAFCDPPVCETERAGMGNKRRGLVG
jgi:hypothetical protein